MQVSLTAQDCCQEVVLVCSKLVQTSKYQKVSQSALQESLTAPKTVVRRCFSSLFMFSHKAKTRGTGRVYSHHPQDSSTHKTRPLEHFREVDFTHKTRPPTRLVHCPPQAENFGTSIVFFVDFYWKMSNLETWNSNPFHPQDSSTHKTRPFRDFKTPPTRLVRTSLVGGDCMPQILW